MWRGLQPDGNLGRDEAIAAAWGSANRRRDHGSQQVPPHGRAVAGRPESVTVPSGATHLFFTRR